MNNELIDILNKIFEMSGESLSEKILDYCETYDANPQEIGDILEESKDFKKLLYRDCVENNIIKDDIYLDYLHKTEVIDEW